MEKKTVLPIPFLIPAFLCLMTGVSMALAGYPVIAAPTQGAKLAAFVIAPILFSAAYTALAALLGLPFQKAIIPGKFPRKLSHFIYGPRRLYGLCWGAIFYFTPLYFALTSTPVLRKLLLWSFGYRGHPDINIAPDAWIRDLPLLKFSQGVYVANKSTIGTNICLADEHVLVDAVTLGTGAMIGHLAMVAPGTVIGNHAEVGVGCGIGIRVHIGSRTRIGPTSTVNHGAQIGSGVEIGTMSYIGVKAKVADGVRLPGGSNIPEGADIRNHEDVIGQRNSETALLEQERARLQRLYTSHLRPVTSLKSGGGSGSAA